MHFVNDNFPHRCAVIPGRTKDPRGFIKTDVVLTGWDPEIEISVAGAEELGKRVGMVPKAQVEELAARANELAAELAVVKQRLEDINTLKEIQVKVRQPIGGNGVAA